MLFIIANYKDEKRYTKLIDKYKVGFKVVMYGYGTASSSMLEYFGLSREDKSIITAIVPKTICKNIINAVEEKTKLKEHGKTRTCNR